MTGVPTPRVAIVWRGDRQARDAATGAGSRFKAIFTALATEGLAPEPAVYDESFANEVREQLLGVAAVLVFVINKRSFGWTLLFRLDGGLFAQALLLALAAALLAGLYPAWRMSRTSPALALREE